MGSQVRGVLEYGFCNPGPITKAANLTGGLGLRRIYITVRAFGGPDASHWLLSVVCGAGSNTTGSRSDVPDETPIHQQEL